VRVGPHSWAPRSPFGRGPMLSGRKTAGRTFGLPAGPCHTPMPPRRCRRHPWQGSTSKRPQKGWKGAVPGVLETRSGFRLTLAGASSMAHRNDGPALGQPAGVRAVQLTGWGDGAPGRVRRDGDGGKRARDYQPLRSTMHRFNGTQARVRSIGVRGPTRPGLSPRHEPSG
jgi:hypothetical protein